MMVHTQPYNTRLYSTVEYRRQNGRWVHYRTLIYGAPYPLAKSKLIPATKNSYTKVIRYD